MKCLLLLVLCAAIAFCEEEAVDQSKKLSAEEICNSPTHLPGPQCAAFFKRYTYNKDKKECEEFVYGGCRPSPNNFETIEECKATCVKA